MASKNDESRPLLSTNSVDVDSVLASSTSVVGYHSCGVGVPDLSVRTYWYRWYVLALFSIMAAMCNIGWNTWGPIENSSRAVFGWSKGTISLLSDWGAITFVLAVFPSAWVLDVRGLRVATVLASSFLVVGTGMRCISHEPYTATILIHIGQVMIGFAGPVGQASATVLSSTWFPPNQRTTATAIASLASYCGTALSFVMGPNVVKDIDTLPIEKGHPGYEAALQAISHQIMKLMYIQFGICSVVLVLVLVSYPGKPPKPPSATASVERVDFKVGLGKLLRNRQFQLIAFLYGLTTGVYSAWCSDLAINLHEFRISNETASWLGFWAVVAGAVSGIALSLVADHLGALKLLLILMFIVASAGFGVFALICVEVVPRRMSLFYLTSVIGGLCLNGAIPLFFELAVESSYPVAEGINTGFMTFSNNIYCLIFLSLPLIEGLGTSWMNWFLVASCVICVPLMMLFKETYRRLQIDLTSDPPISVANSEGDANLRYPGSLNA